MRRVATAPREDWKEKIEEQGLVFWRTDLPDGGQISYWHEEHHYAISSGEVARWEATTNVLLDLLVEAGDHVIAEGLWERFGIPDWAAPRIAETWESEPPMLYGRFDLALAPDGRLKLLEFNADTPTCLLETAVQWHWLVDKFGDGADQWNRVHEALVERWTEMRVAARLPDGHVHFLHTNAELSGEDFVTTAYLMETARQSGLKTSILPIEHVAYDESLGFLGAEGEPIRTAFKLYPWEWMVHEEFGRPAVRRMGAGTGETQWIEPIWKMLWSNKAILPVLWELFPGHDNLLPAFFETDLAADDPRRPRDYVRKPILAREGANAEVVRDGAVVERGPDQGYGEEGFVIQEFVDLGDHDGAHPVLGVWVVDMEPVGLGIRESDSLVTDNLSRFVPHVID